MAQSQSTLTFITESIPDFTVGVRQHVNIEASGGTPPYRFEITDGKLPRGLRFYKIGRISGTAREEGSVTVFVELRDRERDSLTQAFNIQTVAP